MPATPDLVALQHDRERIQISGRTNSRAYLQARLKGLMVKTHAEAYLDTVVEAWEKGMRSPGKLHKMWGVFVDEKQLKLTALEALVYVVDFMPSDSNAIKRITMAALLGRHLEFALWLAHPAMRTWGYQAGGELVDRMRKLGGHDLGYATMRTRLTNEGFHLAVLQQKLSPLEEQALGMLFLQLILPMGIVEPVMIPWMSGGRLFMHRGVAFAPQFWERLKRWEVDREKIHRNAPMAIPPKPWSNNQDGGYLMLPGKLHPGDDQNFAYHFKQAQPMVLGAVNRLQEQAWRLDEGMVDVVRTCWQRGFAIGELPSKNRLDEPDEKTYFDGDKRAYWGAKFAWVKDRNADPNRLRAVSSIVMAERLLKDDAPLHYVHNIDKRGRIYPRGGPFTYSSGEMYRSWFLWDQAVPVKGNEATLTSALGEYRGAKGTRRELLEQAIADRQLLAAIGDDPLSHFDLWAQAKSPFRFVQACREWAAYCRDQSHQSAIVVGLDQVTSAYGHLACLMRDENLALMSNVIGRTRFDLYEWISGEARALMLEDIEEREDSGQETSMLAWWLDHWPDRKVFKNCVMPLVYGRTYQSLHAHVMDHLNETLGAYVTKEGWRAQYLGHMLAKRVNRACGQALPQVPAFSKWVGRYCGRWIDRGTYPRWLTPNGLLVDRYTHEAGYENYTLPVGGRRVSFTARKVGGLLRPKRWGGHTADLIHSFDAAFCQRAVYGWAGPGPIASIHDCFLTDLASVPALGPHLQGVFREMYQLPWLELIDRYQLEEMPYEDMERKTHSRVPITGDLALGRIGENPALFS